jgi:hypothetical protein
MIYYFQTCCVKINESDNYFGVNDITLTSPILGNVYAITIPSFSGCSILIEGPIPSGSLIYNGTNGNATLYPDCQDCLDNSYSCFPPIPPQPPITYTQANECDVITIFPMTIECDSINPSSLTSNDGRVSVSITGGTPPYNYIWGGSISGNISPAVMNLPVGSYPVTIVDYYGDFTAATICELTSTLLPTPSVTPTPTLTPNASLTPTPTPTITPTSSSGPLWYLYKTCLIIKGEHQYILQPVLTLPELTIGDAFINDTERELTCWVLDSIYNGFPNNLNPSLNVTTYNTNYFESILNNIFNNCVDCSKFLPSPNVTTTTTTINPNVCTSWRIENIGVNSIFWSGIVCETTQQTSGTIIAGQTFFTTCIIDGTLTYTGGPIVTINQLC